MAFRRQKCLRALILGPMAGLVILSGGCDGGGAPPNGAQVQDPPPIRTGAESARPQPPGAAAPNAKAPATKAP